MIPDILIALFDQCQSYHTMLGVLEKPTATQPLALPTKVKSRRALSSLFVSIPIKNSHSLMDCSQLLGKPRVRRYCEAFPYV